VTPPAADRPDATIETTMHDHQRIRLLLQTGALAALFAAGALAQAPGAGAGIGATPQQDEVVLSPEQLAKQQTQRDVLMPKCYLRGVEVRVPSEMRDSEPQLLGLEEAGITFRDRTPALAEGDLKPAILDPEALRQQRLAAYDRPWTPFGAPLGEVALPAAPPARPKAGADAKPTPPGGGGLVWTLVLALALGGGGYVVQRRRAQA
jgi:hypothetical protein